MPHYLVTGGAGFIGSHLIRSLLAEGNAVQVTCVDNFDPFYPRELKELNLRDLRDNPRFRILTTDISSEGVRELERGVPGSLDAVLHIAAKAGVRPSIENPLAYQMSNVIGLQRMLDFAKARGVEQFVFASSSSVYGVNDNFPWREDDRLLPISPYAMTKLAGEMLGHVYTKLFGIRFIALRFFTVYGPGQRPDLAIHKFTKAMLRDLPITVYGNGSTSRDYTYIDDVVKGIRAAIGYRGSPFEIINLGNSYAVTLNELVTTLEQVLGRRAVLRREPDQPGDVPKTFADIGKAKALLGYHPATTLREGLQRFAEWFRENQELLQR